MAVPDTGLDLLNGNSETVQNENVSGNVKLHEQTQARQDISGNVKPENINATVSCSITGTKHSNVGSNQNTETNNSTEDIDDVYVENQRTNGKTAEPKKDNFYFHAYSYTTIISLFNDINIVPLAQSETDEEKDGTDIDVSKSDSAKVKNSTGSGNAEKLEKIHWISEDLFRAYPAKISINNQNNPLLARVRSLFSNQIYARA